MKHTKDFFEEIGKRTGEIHKNPSESNKTD